MYVHTQCMRIDIEGRLIVVLLLHMYMYMYLFINWILVYHTKIGMEDNTFHVSRGLHQYGDNGHGQ